jgi:SPP1 family phage portal protein
LNEKRAYKIKKARVSNDPTAIYEIGENYDGFPIVPCFGNQFHQSELVGQRTQIDAYDLIKSGFANDLDDVQQIYWILKNAGGMDELDLARFVDALNRTRTALLDDGVELDQKTAEIPYQARESYLTRLENDLYNDAMALNVKQLASGNVTATAINAAYQQLDDKVDMFQSCIEDFVDGILELAGVEDTYRFQRSKVTNQQEVTQMVLSAAQYLDRETVLKLLPFINPEDIEGILKRVDAEESNRYELPIDDGNNEDNNEDDNEGNGDNEDDGNDE